MVFIRLTFSQTKGVFSFQISIHLLAELTKTLYMNDVA